MTQFKEKSAGRESVRLLDPPEMIRRKVRRAVTDTGSDVRSDPAAKPGVSNLLQILAALAGPGAPQRSYQEQPASYRELKEAVASAVIAELEPLQRRYRELAADPGELDRLRRAGAARARELAAGTLARARRAIGAA
jgi:tryptophanyl-tRNA synthetase